MKHGRSQHPYGVLALAARAALRFAARRPTSNRHDGWRPVALFWRRKPKGPEGLRARRMAPAAAAMWLPQFHLHFITRVNDRPQRNPMPGLSPIAAFHQRRVVTDYQRTIIRSSMYAAQPHRTQRPVRPARSDVGANVKAAAPYGNAARRPIVPPIATWVAGRAQRAVRVFALRTARGASGANVQVSAPHANSDRRPIVPPTATWAAGRAQRPDLGRTYPSVHLSKSTNAQAQTGQTPRLYKREPHLFRSRSAVISNAVPPRLHKSTAPQLDFRPQELVWRRAMQPAATIADNKQQSAPRDLAHQAQGRSISGNEAASGMSHLFGQAQASSAIKFDSSLMDRLADDVIRRIERRVRIERARRGL